MSQPKIQTLFFFTDKQGARLDGLSKENNALNDLFSHYTERIDYQPRVNFQDKDFNQAFAQNGAAAVLFHIGAHGNPEHIVSETDDEEQSLLTAERLKAYLKPCKGLVVIFLNACKSDNLARDLVESLPIALAIGTTDDINDDCAAACAEAFYRALLKGRNLGDAVSLLELRSEEKKFPNIYVAHWRDENAKNEILFPPQNKKDSPTDCLWLNTARAALPSPVLGRDEDIKAIRSRLEAEKQVLLMNSMGGVGKTTAALYYAQTYRNDYVHILWVSGDYDIESALLADTDLLVNLEIAEKILPLLQSSNRDIALAILKKALFALPTPVLWLVDNANEGAYTLVKEWQQSHPTHHFLLTARDSYHQTNPYRLDYLSEAAALELFYIHAGTRHQNPENDALLLPLIAELWRHTLAIVLVAKTFQAKQTNDLAAFVQATEQGIIASTKNLHIRVENYDGKDHIAAILGYVFDTAALAQNAPALHLLVSLSVLPSQDLRKEHLVKLLIEKKPTFLQRIKHFILRMIGKKQTYSKIDSGIYSEDDLTNALNTLLKTGWIEQPNAAEYSYHCHLLIQETVRLKQGITVATVLPLVNCILTFLNHNIKENKWWQNVDYLPYAIAVVNNLKEEEKILADLQHNIAYTLKEQGKYSEAMDYFKKALAIQEKVHGKDHPDTTTIYNNIAALHTLQGNYTEVMDYYQKDLAIEEKVLRTDDSNTATTYNNIAALHTSQGNYTEAMHYYQTALAIQEKILGTDHPDTTAIYNNIGLLHDAQGNYPKAMDYYQKALAIQEKIFGTDHPNTATTYNNIGALHKVQENYTEAIHYYQKALAIQEKVLGTDHPDTAITYVNIAGLHKGQGKYAEAMHYYQKALAICEKVLGTDHSTTATTYNNIAELHRVQGNNTEAMRYYQKALAIQGKVLGTDHPDTSATYNNIALLYYQQRNYILALEYLKKAIQVWKKTLPSQHPNTKTAIESYRFILDNHKDALPQAVYKEHRAFLQTLL